MLEELKLKLEKYGQEHLLKNYDSLNEAEKQELITQVKGIDYSVLEAYKHYDKEVKRGEITPIDAMKIPEINSNREKFLSTGVKTIKEGKVGAVLLAGGQGTRLGFDKPKGMLNVGINKEIYLFEILINNLIEVVNEVGAWVHLFVMTSEINNNDTVGFFKENNFFGYNKDYVTFFVQDMSPAVDYNGKIYMEDKGRISVSPNGNGGWFSSMARNGILDLVKNAGIEWLNVFSVDNVLQKIADPMFVGATVLSGYPVSAKVIRKTDPFERVGVMCKENGKPSIVEYYELTEEMALEKDDSEEYVYNFGVILNYMFRVKELEEILSANMPMHIVEKKIPYMDDNQNYIKPEEPNGYKFETLVLDMINMMDNCLVYEVEREKEFAPIKNKDGVDSLVTAREFLIKNGVEI